MVVVRYFRVKSVFQKLRTKSGEIKNKSIKKKGVVKSKQILFYYPNTFNELVFIYREMIKKGYFFPNSPMRNLQKHE